MNTAKKRVAHVTFNMGIGGAEQVIFHLLTHSENTKYESSIICLDQPIGPFGKRLQLQGYKVSSFNRKPGFDLSLVRDIHKYILQHNISILHCHQYTPYVYGVLGAIFTKAKVVFTEHGRFFPDQRKVKRFYLNPLMNLITAHVVAISSATGDALIRYENFPSKKIRIIYNGIDDSRHLFPCDPKLRALLGIDAKASILGTIGRLDSIKNQKMMIKALGMIKKSWPETVLLIVGDGPERTRLEDFTSSQGLTSSVIFSGFKEDSHRYLALMDIFLLTSFSEGTAMTILEAMASGIPSIVTDVGGNPEIVQDEITGFLVPSDDESALAEKIEKLFIDQDQARKMGKAARERFEEAFTVEEMVQAYQVLYDS